MPEGSSGLSEVSCVEREELTCASASDSIQNTNIPMKRLVGGVVLDCKVLDECEHNCIVGPGDCIVV